VQDAHGVCTGRVLVRPLWVVVLRDGERSSLRVLAKAARGQNEAVFEWHTVLRSGVNKVEGALDVVAAFLLIFKRDLEVAVLLGYVELVWPVLAAALHALLHQFREHDYGGDSVLADHAPEVDDCLALGPLGGDEFLVVGVALDKVGVDVVALVEVVVELGAAAVGGGGCGHGGDY